MGVHGLGFLAVAVSCSLAVTAGAQQWVDRADTPRGSGTILIDGGMSGQPMIANPFGLWTYDGQAWQRGEPLPSVPQHIWDAAGNPLTEELVALFSMVGGEQRIYIYDGIRWVDRGVPPAYLTDLHFDPAVGAIVAFSGDIAGVVTEDWVWNGSSWTARPRGIRPVGVRGAITADLGRGRVVVVTDVIPGPPGETWEWDGVAWRRMAGPQTNPVVTVWNITYDRIRGQVVLFGGQERGTNLLVDDTWLWDGVRWTLSNPAGPRPPASSTYGICFDPVIEEVLLLDSGGQLGGDWRWNGVRWAHVGPKPGGSASGIATDFNRRRVVRLGRKVPNVTWEWDGRDWVRFTVPAPPRRYGVMTSNATTGRTVLFGGRDSVGSSNQTIYGDTWLWDGATTSWTQATPAQAPSPRYDHALAYHVASGGVILFGGMEPGYVASQETWLWDGANWTDLTPTLAVVPPAGRAVFESVRPGEDPHLESGGQLWKWDGSWHQVAARTPIPGARAFGRDPVSGNPVMTGRLSWGRHVSCEWQTDRWRTWQTEERDYLNAVHDPLSGALLAHVGADMSVYTSHPASATRYGSSCGPTAPMHSAHGFPRISNRGFGLLCRQLPSASVAFLAGVARTNQTISGCRLLVDTPFHLGFATANSMGSAILPLPLPYVAALRGVEFYTQCLVTSPAGPVLSNGLAVRIGD